MNFFKKFIILLIVSCCYGETFAANPPDGVYFGIELGASYMPSLTVKTSSIQPDFFTYAHSTIPNVTPLTLRFTTFGDIGGQIGFRINPFRIEAQGIFNDAPIKSLSVSTVGSSCFVNGSIGIDNNFCINNNKHVPEYRIKGESMLFLGLLNGYYDLILEDCDFAPYIGAGVGYAYTRTLWYLVTNNNTSAAESDHVGLTGNTFAAQATIGIAYFLDDFTTAALEYRYLATNNFSSPNRNYVNGIINQNRVQVHAIQLVVNGMFC